MRGRHGRERVSAGEGAAPRRRRRKAAGSAPSRRPEPAAPGRAAAGSRAIFRQEALEFHARGREMTGGVVRLGAPWIKWTYRLALALVTAGVCAAALVPVGRSSDGMAVVDASGRFAATFPAAVAPELATARGLSLALPGAPPRQVRVVGMRAALAGQAALGRAGLPASVQPAILLTGRLAGPPWAGVKGRSPAQAMLALPPAPLGEVLAHELAVMLGRGGNGR